MNTSHAIFDDPVAHKVLHLLALCACWSCYRAWSYTDATLSQHLAAVQTAMTRTCMLLALQDLGHEHCLCRPVGKCKHPCWIRHMLASMLLQLQLQSYTSALNVHMTKHA